MPVKMARSAPRPPFGLPRMTAVVRAAKRSCQNAAKAQKSTTVRGSSGRIPDKKPSLYGNHLPWRLSSPLPPTQRRGPRWRP